MSQKIRAMPIEKRKDRQQPREKVEVSTQPFSRRKVGGETLIWAN